MRPGFTEKVQKALEASHMARQVEEKELRRSQTRLPGMRSERSREGEGCIQSPETKTQV